MVISTPSRSIKKKVSEIRSLSLALLFFICLIGAFGGRQTPFSTRLARGESITDSVFGEIINVDSPVPAVVIESGDIPVGEAHTYTYNLRKGHRYHIYLAGDWANPTTHKTDYDIFVYEISGLKARFLSSHTEAAGLPEQVGNDGLGQYFTPEESGLYYISVRNDAVESSAAEAATLMVIERIETSQWLRRSMEGKKNEKPVEKTNWAYEFVTDARRIRIFLEVPDILDMYEARLYVVANPAAGKGELLKGVPIAWEPGLRAQRSGIYGGFNFDPQGYRDEDAMASCEWSGEDMVIDYNSPVKGELLYHLVLIAEYGSGTLDFVVQTDFDPPDLQLVDPPSVATANEPTILEVGVADESEIGAVSLSYTRNGGSTWEEADVDSIGDGRYHGIIRGVKPGTLVEYVFGAEDAMGNLGETRGRYTAMGDGTLEIEMREREVLGGEEVEVRGQLLPWERDVVVSYNEGDDEYNFTVATDVFGLFSHAFRPESTGEWWVYAEYKGDGDYHPVTSERLNFTVSSLSPDLTCTVSKERVELGKRVTVSGDFGLEKAGVVVEITLKGKDQIDTLRATTSPHGNYSIDYELGSKGEWSVLAKVKSDGLVYEGATSEAVKLKVVNPTLTTTLIRLPAVLADRAGGFMKPPYLYGVIGLVGVVGGGVVFYIRRRE